MMPTNNGEEIALNPMNGKMANYKRIFRECDTDGDSVICVRELDALLNSRGAQLNVSRAVVIEIHKMTDKNGDKKLDFAEFVDMMEHPHLQHIFEHWVNNYVNFLVPRPKQAQMRIQRDGVQYIDEIKMCPPPLTMLLISVLEFVFYLTDELNEKGSSWTGNGVTGKIFIYDPFKRQEVWRFLTYMFVHIGHIHLSVNLAIQLVLGIPLEMVHCWWRVLTVYFSGVIAGSLMTSITDPWVKLAGASGGVYALLTAHIANIIMNWKEMKFPIVHLLVFGFIISFDVGSSIYERYGQNVDNAVSYAAHFGGALAGLLVGIYVLRNLNATKAENYIWWFALVLFVILIGTAVVLNLVLRSYFPK